MPLDSTVLLLNYGTLGRCYWNNFSLTSLLAACLEQHSTRGAKVNYNP